MPFSSQSVPRDQAGSMTLAKPATTANNSKSAITAEIEECGGNVQLLEAKLGQVTLAIRNLARSNRELEQALLETPDDIDFLQAVAENQHVIIRKGLVAVGLVQQLKANGAKSVELDDDVRAAILQVSQQQQQSEAPPVDAATTPSTAAVTSNTTPPTPNNSGGPSSSGGDTETAAGIYL